MTLRQRLGADVQRIHEQVNDLLDREARLLDAILPIGLPVVFLVRGSFEAVGWLLLRVVP